MNLATFVKQVREENKLSVEDLARLCHSSVDDITKIELDKFHIPNPKVLYNIAIILDLEIAEFIVAALEDFGEKMKSNSAVKSDDKFMEEVIYMMGDIEHLPDGMGYEVLKKIKKNE
ncbi:XRE family transcriptional regulator [Brevibacillus brevis X23]|nr:XRE family transcriptional regulator [Brevibacillus brevis X23]